MSRAPSTRLGSWLLGLVMMAAREGRACSCQWADGQACQKMGACPWWQPSKLPSMSWQRATARRGDDGGKMGQGMPLQQAVGGMVLTGLEVTSRFQGPGDDDGGWDSASILPQAGEYKLPEVHVTAGGCMPAGRLWQQLRQGGHSVLLLAGRQVIWCWVVLCRSSPGRGAACLHSQQCASSEGVGGKAERKPALDKEWAVATTCAERHEQHSCQRRSLQSK